MRPKGENPETVSHFCLLTFVCLEGVAELLSCTVSHNPYNERGGGEKCKSPKSITFGEFAEALSALGPDFKRLHPWDKRSLEEIKLSFFIDNIIEHVENSKESTNKLS